MATFGRFGMVLCTALTMIGLVAVAPAHATSSVQLDIAGQGPNAVVPLDAPVVVEVRAFDIPVGTDGLGMFGMGFTLDYGPDFSLLDIVLGPLWENTGFDDSRGGGGGAGLTSNRFFEADGPSGDGILLGSVILMPTDAGVFPLTLSNFDDPGENVLFDFNTLDGSDDFFGSGTIRVPEPRTLGLMAIGIAGLAVAGRQRPGHSSQRA